MMALSASALSDWRILPADVKLLIARRLEVADFGAWLKLNWPDWPWDYRHLRFMRRELARFTAGDFDRMMFFLPPRHYKSEMVTMRYAAWRLERDPAMRIIIGAYNQTLASTFSRKIRKIMTMRGVALNPEKQKADEWETAAGGGVRAVGVGSGVTGHGADLILIDDPVKSREEAESPAYRRRVINWWADDMETRLEPNGQVILTMTRWHQADLAGHILDGPDGGRWHVVKLPAVATENDPMGRKLGEPLNPERWPLEELKRIEATSTMRKWMSLYQQTPISPTGNVFQRDWWEGRRYSGVKLGRTAIARYISWDTAQKDKEENAYTAMTVGELLPDYRLIVRRVWRDRVTFPALPEAIERWAERYNQDGKLAGVIIEDKSSGTSAIQTLRKSAPPWLRELLIPFQPSGDKIQRAEQAAVWCANGSVWLPEPSDETPWLFDFEDELFEFPSSAFADQVDSFDQLIIYLENILAEGYRAREGMT